MKPEGKAKGKGVSKLLLFGLCLIILLGGGLAARLLLNLPFPFMVSNSQPAPEGVALTITLLAFCKDNSTEVLAVKEYKLSEMALLTTSGKEIKYFAITASFLSGPASDEILQKIDLTYDITMSTDRGTLQTVTKSVSLPIVANLALHQSQVIPITPQELGLNMVGDVALLTSTVKVEADMTTDKGRTVFTSSGNVQTRLAYQEGGFLQSGSASGQVSEEGAGTVVAVLTGTWEKPSWRAVNVVGLVDQNTGVKAYVIAESGSSNVQVTGQTPTSGSTVPTTNVEPPPITGDLKLTPRRTQTTSPSTVTIPYDMSNPDKPVSGGGTYTSPVSDSPGEPRITVSGGKVVSVTKPDGTPIVEITTGYEHEPPDVSAPSGPEPEHYSGDPYQFSWLPVSWAPVVGLFNGYRMLWPIYIFGRTVDLAFILAVFFSIGLVAVGVALTLSKKKS